MAAIQHSSDFAQYNPVQPSNLPDVNAMYQVLHNATHFSLPALTAMYHVCLDMKRAQQRTERTSYSSHIAEQLKKGSCGLEMKRQQHNWVPGTMRAGQ